MRFHLGGAVLLVVLSAGAVHAHDADIAALKARIEQLEKAQKEQDAALNSDRLSEKEPELVTRVKALEMDVRDIKPAARKSSAWDGVAVNADLLYVVQQIDADDQSGRYDNYRFDGSLTLPAGDLQRASGWFFLHARAGQSPSPTELPTSFTGLNGSAFQLGGTTSPEDSALTLTEAWYELDWPVDTPAPGGKSHHFLSFNIGKMDPFVFFDQNAFANDEAGQFLASVFVHNAILDNPLAAQIGTDAYGASPGLRAAWRYQDGAQSIGISGGHFASADDANYSSAMNHSLDLLQLEFSTRFWGGNGNYRLYHFDNDAGPGFDGLLSHKRGWGVSADQQISVNWSGFVRASHAKGSGLPFDQFVALGAELKGNAWLRANDRVGFAYARLQSSDDFRMQAGQLSDFGYPPGKTESVAEIYYRYFLTDAMHTSLHWQHLDQAGANSNTAAIDVLTLRLLWRY